MKRIKMIPLDKDEKNELYIQALAAAGIDTWKWHDEAMKTFNKAKKDALMQKNSKSLTDMLSDFIKDYAVPQSEGYINEFVTTSYSTDEAMEFINNLIAEKKRIEEEIERKAE